MRIYDFDYCRFFSVDPMAQKYPFNSTYAFAENTPVWGSDLDGCEVNINPYNLLLQAANTIYTKLEKANTVAKVTNDYLEEFEKRFGKA